MAACSEASPSRSAHRFESPGIRIAFFGHCFKALVNAAGSVNSTRLATRSQGPRLPTIEINSIPVEFLFTARISGPGQVSHVPNTPAETGFCFRLSMEPLRALVCTTCTGRLVCRLCDATGR